MKISFFVCLNCKIFEDMWVFPPCCQIFMCLLWMLLQFVVLAMYWDVPPVSCEGGATMMEMKQEEVEEEVPLMGSVEEPVHTYRALNSDQLETSTSSDMQPVHRASDPFRNFSASRGEPAGLTACLEQLQSAFLCPILQRSGRKRCHCQCTCFISALLILLVFAHSVSHTLSILQVSLRNFLQHVRSDSRCIDWTCVYMSGLCQSMYIHDVRCTIGLVS